MSVAASQTGRDTAVSPTKQLRDVGFAGLCGLGAVFVQYRYHTAMDAYEQFFLWLSAVSLAVLGWRWRALQGFSVMVALLSLLGIGLYGDQLVRGEQVFWLKYVLSSQSAIMWMSFLFGMATLAYWLALWQRSVFVGKTASGLTWAATILGFTGLMVRWYESYLIGPDVGHIPVSNLYEVFVLFCLLTALMYLYYEMVYQTRQMGGFVLLVIAAAVAFLLWYAFERQAHQIQPLIPALQSYWMKIHVPANFVGYGGFALAAMVAVAWLLVERGVLRDHLPASAVLDDVMYKAIAIGFAFFTVATVLGAFWAAEAWGGYWSWDPKETWALIVWLNYAAWLHIRLVKGVRGRVLAWWALIGLFVTLFAFVGVNMFLSGLHSYGAL